MSTCRTPTSARRDLRDLRRRLFCDCDADADDAAAGRQLETRLRGLERDWDAYQASRSGAPRHRHRRSRSATGTPSSAVTAAGPGGDLPQFLRCSPRRLVYSLQDQDGSGTDSGSAVSVKQRNGGQLRGDEEDDASSVCSVQVEYSMALASSCSCPHHCAALYRRSYSTSSSCTVATESSFSWAGGRGVNTDHVTKTEEGRLVTGYSRVKWVAAVALVVVMGVIVAMAIVELGMDEEFVVPT